MAPRWEVLLTARGCTCPHGCGMRALALLLLRRRASVLAMGKAVSQTELVPSSFDLQAEFKVWAPELSIIAYKGNAEEREVRQGSLEGPTTRCLCIMRMTVSVRRWSHCTATCTCMSLQVQVYICLLSRPDGRSNRLTILRTSLPR